MLPFFSTIFYFFSVGHDNLALNYLFGLYIFNVLYQPRRLDIVRGPKNGYLGMSSSGECVGFADNREDRKSREIVHGSVVSGLEMSDQSFQLCVHFRARAGHLYKLKKRNSVGRYKCTIHYVQIDV